MRTYKYLHHIQKVAQEKIVSSVVFRLPCGTYTVHYTGGPRFFLAAPFMIIHVRHGSYFAYDAGYSYMGFGLKSSYAEVSGICYSFPLRLC